MKDEAHAQAVELRDKIQEGEREARIGAIEEAHFNAAPYGHWEEYATKKFTGKPRYQIDLVKPIIDSIAGEIEQMEIGGQVIPVGSAATEDIAETYEKMLRTISNMSDAPDIYSDSLRNIVDHAYDAWMIVTDWADIDAFDQDILVEKIPDAVNRVWLEGITTATRPEDVKRGFVDTNLTLDEYAEQFPEGSKLGLSDFGHAYDRVNSNEDNTITVSDYYYIKRENTTLHLMSDNSVLSDEDYQKAAAYLAEKGITVVRSKTRELPTCYMRKMDQGGWLTEEQATAFNYIPVIQVMANFQILNKRPYYRGETRKLMDPQRIYDYGTSKDITEGALGRKDKINITPEQAENHEAQNSKLNTADDPLFLYNHTDGQAPPHTLPGSQVDVGLQTTLARTQMDMKEISMSHNPQQGAGLAGHSGKAYEILTEKSNTAAIKYIRPVEKAVAWTNQIIIDAIPRVYDTRNRQVRLTNEDGTSKFVPVNEEVSTNRGTLELINDLSQGRYMFKVATGPAFSSRRAEGVAAIKEWAALDPSIIEEGKDIIYAALNAPGANDISDRVRKRMLEEGRVPEAQLTDEEREQIQKEMAAAAQANQQPNPLDQATVAAIMAQVEDIQSQMQERQMEQERKMMETLAKIQKGEADIQKTQSETLENLKEATGADAIINQNVAQAYDDIASDMNDPNTP